MNHDELCILFDANNRNSFSNINEITKLYGSSLAIFPSLLEAVNGKVVHCEMKSGTVSRAFLGIL